MQDLPSRPTKSDVFDASPRQIKALRRALGWTMEEFAAFVGVTRYNKWSCTVSKWESGKVRPLPVFRAKMLELVDTFYPDYMKELRKRA